MSWRRTLLGRDVILDRDDLVDAVLNREEGQVELQITTSLENEGTLAEAYHVTAAYTPSYRPHGREELLPVADMRDFEEFGRGRVWGDRSQMVPSIILRELPTIGRLNAEGMFSGLYVDNHLVPLRLWGGVNGDRHYDLTRARPLPK